MYKKQNEKVVTPKIKSHPPGKVPGYPILVNPDGTLTRLGPFPMVPATPDPSFGSTVLTKDIPLNPRYNTFIRIFLPRVALDQSSSNTRLPLFVYVHGGGFSLLSAATPIYHNFCVKMVVEMGVAVASIEYRLTPEHRLPAAYDDTMEALHLIAKTDDEWLRDFVDLSNCFLIGNSVGGNIVYHTGVAAATQIDHLKPLKIKGLVLVHATFNGETKTESELRITNDPFTPPNGSDLMWELSLPIGSDRDHQYSNPVANGHTNQWGKLITNSGCRVLIIGCKNDPYYDRQKELVKVMQEEGVNLLVDFWETGYHGIELFDDEKAKYLFASVKFFVYTPQGRL